MWSIIGTHKKKMMTMISHCRWRNSSRTQTCKSKTCRNISKRKDSKMSKTTICDKNIFRKTSSSTKQNMKLCNGSMKTWKKKRIRWSNSWQICWIRTKTMWIESWTKQRARYRKGIKISSICRRLMPLHFAHMKALGRTRKWWRRCARGAYTRIKLLLKTNKE